MRGFAGLLRSRCGWTAFAATLALLSAPRASEAVLIDSFNQTFQEVSNGDPNNPVRQVVMAPEAIGGVRDVLLEVTSNPFFSAGDPTSPEMTVTINPAGTGLALYSEDSGVNGRLTLTYDGNATPGLQFDLGNLNLTAGGDLGFRLRANSDRDFIARILVYTNGSGNVSERELLIPGDPDEAQREFFLPYASFTGNADFTDVDAIQLVLDGVLGRTDIDIDNLGTDIGGPAAIPEPGSLALLGMGALGLFGVGYRRRKPASA